MVKIGLELVDKQLSLVMGREEADMTETLCIIPLESNTVEVRLTGTARDILGEFRTPDAAEWKLGGQCPLPILGTPKASIQAYQGAPDTKHWAKIHGFRITHVSPKL